jgi:hypothetical protein
MTCAITRPCCQTADHGPDCRCWRCVCVVLTHELDAMQWAAELPDIKTAAKSTTKPKREAPQVTIDALLYCYHTRGQAAFNEPANRLRLADLSPRQRDELRQRIERMKGAA